MRWSDLTPPDLLDRQAERIRQHQTYRASAAVREGVLPERRYPRARAGRRFQVRRTGKPGVGFVLDLSERKRAEEEHRAHVWFLESMDRINRAMQGTNDLERMMSDVLDAVLEIFACDRAWLLYPCDPRRSVLARGHGAHAAGVPGRGRPRARSAHDGGPAEVARAALDSQRRPARRAGSRAPGEAGDRASASPSAREIAMALRPKGDRPYLVRLAPVLARAHLDDGRAAPFRGDRPSAHRRAEQPHRLPQPARKRAQARGGAAASRASAGGSATTSTGHVSLSDEACRIFGVQPVDLPQWHGRWLNLIHPEDRPRDRGRERAGAARRSALRRRVPGGAPRRRRARGAQPGRRHPGRVRPSGSPVRRHAGHHRAAATRSAGSRRRSASRASAGGSATTPPASG